jgi:hypothetical protein
LGSHRVYRCGRPPPPHKVSHTLCYSALCGRMSHTNLLYVIYMSRGTCVALMNLMVSVTLISLISCVSLTNSLAKAFSHTGHRSSCFGRWRFSSCWPVSSLVTACAVSMHGSGVSRSWYTCSSCVINAVLYWRGLHHGISGHSAVVIVLAGLAVGTLGDGPVHKFWCGTLSVGT